MSGAYWLTRSSSRGSAPLLPTDTRGMSGWTTAG